MEKAFYLFDFDGTLVDSMETWAGVHINALKNAGIEVPADFVETITPLGNYNASKYTISLGIDIPLKTYLDNISKALYKEYTTRISLKANVLEALKKLKNKNISLNVLTASPHLYVDPCLNGLGIYDYFDNVWTIEDFGLTKAQPAIYQKAAEKLGTDINNCTMIDDNFTAISTAKTAGMNTIAVYDSTSKASENLLKKTADKYIYSFKEF